MVTHDDYPADHDPILPALMEAASRTKDAGDLDAAIVCEAVLEHYAAGQMGDLARLIEENRKPLPVGAWTLTPEDFPW